MIVLGSYLHCDEALYAAWLDLDAGTCDFDDSTIEHFTNFRCASDCFECHWENDIATRVLYDPVPNFPIWFFLIPYEQYDVAVFRVASSNVGLLNLLPYSLFEVSTKFDWLKPD